MSNGIATIVMWVLAIFSLVFVVSLPSFIPSDIMALLYIMPLIFAVLGMAFAIKG